MAQAGVLHPTTALHCLRPASSARWLGVSLVPTRLGCPLPPSPVHGALLGKQDPRLARISPLVAPATADEGTTAVGAEAVDINVWHKRPPLAAARLHLWRTGREGTEESLGRRGLRERVPSRCAVGYMGMVWGPGRAPLLSHTQKNGFSQNSSCPGSIPLVL